MGLTRSELHLKARTLASLFSLACRVGVAVVALTFWALSNAQGAASVPGPREVSAQAVRDHVGGDDRHADTFVYTAPDGWSIRTFNVIELSKYGDATYSPRLVSPKRLEIPWQTQSRTVRTLGIVVDTKTASLNLDVTLTLIPDPTPRSQASPSESPISASAPSVLSPSQPNESGPSSSTGFLSQVNPVVLVAAFVALFIAVTLVAHRLAARSLEQSNRKLMAEREFERLQFEKESARRLAELEQKHNTEIAQYTRKLEAASTRVPPSNAKGLDDIASSEAVILEPPAPPPEPTPEIPKGLVDALSINECVAFVGSGLAARSGLPTWRGFVEGLVDEARRTGVMSEPDADQQRAALADGEINAVADNAISAFASSRDGLLDYYRRAFAPNGPVPRAVALMRRIPFVGILTTNYDKMLLGALRGSTTSTLTPKDGESLLQAHAQASQPYLVQLYGDLDRPDTVVTAPAEYLDLVRTNAAFSRFIEGVFFSRTILFLGTSIEGLSDFLSGFRFPSGVPRPHYALIAVQGKSWQAKAQTLKRRYNIEVLAYPESQGYVQFDDFLAAIVRRVQAGAPPSHDVSGVGDPNLTRIELRNIGPFASLDLDISKLRTILLGDNGVGKSTILKAIALAIVGSEGRHYAARILKSGESFGSVSVMTRRNPSGYLTEIQRVGTDAEVFSRSGRMLETEGWVALGFPPLRTTSWSPTKGPQGVTTRRPTAADVLPLLSGDIDYRMDDLKQWLVNTDAATRDKRGTPESIALAKRVLKTFIGAVGTLAEGLYVSFEEVTPDFRVLVRTPDGVVQIEALSQGMTSLLSWIGIVVQRLHEIAPEDVDPMNGPALILMDEIDAHMHPAWQQKLLPRLQSLLPNVQIIASTHSPLVVAGLEVSEVVRFDRDSDGRVVRLVLEKDMTIGRADQILTGDLFGLDSTLALGERGETVRVEYESLLAKSRRNEAEDARFAQLGSELNALIPSGLAENKLERRSQELARAVLTTDFEAAGPDAARALTDKATQVIQSMGWSEVGSSRIAP